MVKKLALAAAGAALVLAVAVPAFAGEDHHRGHDSSSLTIRNRGTQLTTSLNFANTGFNTVGGGEAESEHHHRGHDNNGGSITTGDAWIFSDTEANMNYTSVGGCGCFKKVDVNNDGRQTTFSLNVANTGFNSVSGNGSIGTGDAGVDSLVLASLNTTVVGE